VQGSESTAERLQCIAAWKEGSKKYLVAELSRGEHFVHSDEARFKCFVYERVGSSKGGGGGDERGGGAVRMAQSESATCSGLWSAHEGFRTFDMETGEYILFETINPSKVYKLKTFQAFSVKIVKAFKTFSISSNLLISSQ
jgi:hypothetical protein